MKIIKRNIMLLFLILALTPTLLAQDHNKLDQGPKLLVRVDGLSCPFCAYGLEKKLLKIDRVKAVKILVDEGEALLTINKDTEIDENVIRQEIKKAGFTAREIVFVDKKILNEH